MWPNFLSLGAHFPPGNRTLAETSVAVQPSAPPSVTTPVASLPPLCPLRPKSAPRPHFPAGTWGGQYTWTARQGATFAQAPSGIPKKPMRPRQQCCRRARPSAQSTRVTSPARGQGQEVPGHPGSWATCTTRPGLVSEGRRAQPGQQAAGTCTASPPEGLPPKAPHFPGPLHILPDRAPPAPCMVLRAPCPPTSRRAPPMAARGPFPSGQH